MHFYTFYTHTRTHTHTHTRTHIVNSAQKAFTKWKHIGTHALPPTHHSLTYTLACKNTCKNSTQEALTKFACIHSHTHTTSLSLSKKHIHTHTHTHNVTHMSTSVQEALTKFRYMYTVEHNSNTILQPIPEKMKLEMVIRIQIEILDGHHRFLFIRLIWKETSTFTFEIFVLYSDDHFESHLPGNGLLVFGSDLNLRGISVSLLVGQIYFVQMPSRWISEKLRLRFAFCKVTWLALPLRAV